MLKKDNNVEDWVEDRLEDLEKFDDIYIWEISLFFFSLRSRLLRLLEI